MSNERLGVIDVHTARESEKRDIIYSADSRCCLACNRLCVEDSNSLNHDESKPKREGALRRLTNRNTSVPHYDWSGVQPVYFTEQC